MNIYESISAVMAEVGAVGKNSKNNQQNFMYRGVDAVMNALSPALTKCKVFVVPEVLEQTREERTTAKGALLIYSICKIKFTFYAEDGTSISATVIGEGMDSGDKATNKAMSIAFKYACFQVFCIPTEEMADPDAECHEVIPEEPKKAITSPPQRKNNSAKNPAAPQGNVKPEAEMTKPTDKVDETQLRAMRIRIKNAAAKGKRLDESDLCKMFKIEKLEDMTYELLLKFNALMDKAGV